MKKAVLTSFTILLFVVFFMDARAQIVQASRTIYIRSDGSVDPPTANISSIDNVIYTFTDNNFDEIVVEKSNIIVDGKGYTLQGSGNGVGFYLYDTSNVTIQNTNIQGFDDGIFLYASSDNSINNNTITNHDDGIFLYASSDNSINNNTITNHDDGIFLYTSSDHNSINNNTITNNGEGILLSCSSDHNSINNNKVTANDLYGIWLVDSSDNSINNNKVTANDLYGIYLSFSSDHNSINNNNLEANKAYGIYLSSSDNSINNNTITNNWEGIRMHSSSHNSINNNNVTASFYYGIYLSSSSDNSINNNTITDNDDGIYLSGFSDHNSINNNKVTANDGIGIYLSSSSDNSINNNTITDNDDGIYLSSLSDHNSINNNKVTANDDIGIYLNGSSDYNSIYGNNISNHTYGVSVQSDCGYNRFLHNNIVDDQVVDKGTTIWDNGAEGNYWGNYTGKDEDGNGIGDTSYVLDAENNIQDEYPLMEPWSSTRILNITWNEKTYIVKTVSNSTIAPGEEPFSQTDRQVSFRTTGSKDTMGFCNITIPKELLMAPLEQWTITLIEETAVPSVTENDTHTIIYFTFTHHNTQTVNITGTNPIDNTPPLADAGPDQTVEENTPTSFNASASTDNIEIKNYTWTFPDEVVQTHRDVVNHSFTTPGTHPITLNVTDLRGNWDTDSITVTVLAIPLWNQLWFRTTLFFLSVTSGFLYLVLWYRKREEYILGRLQKLARQYVWEEIPEGVFEKRLETLKKKADVETLKCFDDYVSSLVTFWRGRKWKEKVMERS